MAEKGLPVLRPRTVAYLFGVPIRIHWSLLAICPFVIAVTSLGEGYVNPHWNQTPSLTVGLMGAFIYCASTFLHEGGHFLALHQLGISVESLTFNAWGGRIRGQGAALTPRIDFVVSAAGPASTLLLAGLGFGALVLLGPTGPLHAREFAVTLGIINLILLPGCILPVWPTDTARVLRAILWQCSGDKLAATRAVCRLNLAITAGFLAAGAALVAHPLLPEAQTVGAYAFLAGGVLLV